MSASMWNNGGVWRLHIRVDKLHIILPVPLYVLTDLLDSMEDICELILPRFGHPNYAVLLRDLIAELNAGQDAPLVDITTGDARVLITPIRWKGRG